MSKGNLIFFERKELILLIILLVLIALLAFTLGVKLGRDLQINPQARQDQEQVDSEPLSIAAEEVPSQPEQAKNSPQGTSEIPKMESDDSRIKQSALAQPEKDSLEKRGDTDRNEPDFASLEKKLKKETASGPSKVYTLQISSHRTQADASKEKNRLLKKGFPAQVIQVDLPKKGTWYRVSVGAFGSKEKARSYGDKLKKKLPGQSFILQTL